MAIQKQTTLPDPGSYLREGEEGDRP
ncbi:hypothetical protein A2U01_0119100, partial [Trifolium medium]|nr:hypothetical protein [Trifolium medium]